MTKTVYVRLSYADKISEEIAINLESETDLTKNSNRKKLLNRLLKSNSNITEVSLIS
jgi:plasmid maintenance system antidote protein VapI